MAAEKAAVQARKLLKPSSCPAQPPARHPLGPLADCAIAGLPPLLAVPILEPRAVSTGARTQPSGMLYSLGRPLDYMLEGSSKTSASLVRGAEAVAHRIGRHLEASCGRKRWERRKGRHDLWPDEPQGSQQSVISGWI